eukprot:scaffold2111_cov130-Isochrysis_galbana.AAC.6
MQKVTTKWMAKRRLYRGDSQPVALMSTLSLASMPKLRPKGGGGAGDEGPWGWWCTGRSGDLEGQTVDGLARAAVARGPEGARQAPAAQQPVGDFFVADRADGKRPEDDETHRTPSEKDHHHYHGDRARQLADGREELVRTLLGAVESGGGAWEVVVRVLDALLGAVEGGGRAREVVHHVLDALLAAEGVCGGTLHALDGVLDALLAAKGGGGGALHVLKEVLDTMLGAEGGGGGSWEAVEHAGVDELRELARVEGACDRARRQAGDADEQGPLGLALGHQRAPVRQH